MWSWAKLVACVIILCGVLGEGLSAYAQEGVEGLLEAALTLREQGRDAEALELFRRAHALEPSGRTAAQLGLVHQALGQWLEAEGLLSEALGSGDAWVLSRRGPLEQAYAAVLTRVGELSVVGSPAGARIFVDGREVGQLPLSAPVRVLSGVRELEVRMEGHVPFRIDVRVATGQLARQSVALVPRLEPEGSGPASEHTPNVTTTAATGRDYGWTIGFAGATLALAATMVGVGVHTQSVYDGLAASCGVNGCSDGEIASSGLEAGALATNVFLAATLAAGVAFTISAVVESTTPASSSAEIELGLGSLRVRGRF